MLTQTPSAPAFGPYRPGRLIKPARSQLLREHQPSSLPDLIAGFHANPLRDGPVLLLLLGEEAFDLERLMRRHGAEQRGVPAMAASDEAERGRGGDGGAGTSAPCRPGGPARSEGRRRPSEFVRVYLGIVQKTAMAKIR